MAIIRGLMDTVTVGPHECSIIYGNREAGVGGHGNKAFGGRRLTGRENEGGECVSMITGEGEMEPDGGESRGATVMRRRGERDRGGRSSIDRVAPLGG